MCRRCHHPTDGAFRASQMLLTDDLIERYAGADGRPAARWPWEYLVVPVIRTNRSSSGHGACSPLPYQAHIGVRNGLVYGVPTIFQGSLLADRPMFLAQIFVGAVDLQNIGKLVDCTGDDEAPGHFIFDQTLAAGGFCCNDR